MDQFWTDLRPIIVINIISKLQKLPLFYGHDQDLKVNLLPFQGSKKTDLKSKHSQPLFTTALFDDKELKLFYVSFI